MACAGFVQLGFISELFLAVSCFAEVLWHFLFAAIAWQCGLPVFFPCSLVLRDCDRRLDLTPVSQPSRGRLLTCRYCHYMAPPRGVRRLRECSGTAPADESSGAFGPSRSQPCGRWKIEIVPVLLVPWVLCCLIRLSRALLLVVDLGWPPLPSLGGRALLLSSSCCSRPPPAHGEGGAKDGSGSIHWTPRWRAPSSVSVASRRGGSICHGKSAAIALEGGIGGSSWFPEGFR
ncbi:hypothetical protein ACP4OV_021421 [Aristida adscensionis]